MDFVYVVSAAITDENGDIQENWQPYKAFSTANAAYEVRDYLKTDERVLAQVVKVPFDAVEMV